MLRVLLVAVIFNWLGVRVSMAAEKADVTAVLDIKQAGAVIPSDFVGLSFEVSLLMPNSNGVRYFRPDNQPLLQLFRTMGIGSLRIGGNTSDRDSRKLPGPADWDSLFAFARAAHVKVIYCLKLHGGESKIAAQTVKYIMDHYAPLMDSFSIGQEPSAYPLNHAVEYSSNDPVPAVEKYSYSAYAREWKQFADTIVATVPSVKFCGPGVHNDPRWATEFIEDFGRSNHVAMITEHLYPGGAGGKVPSPEIGRDEMLADSFVKTYQKLHDGFVPMAVSHGLPYRLEEVNNFYNGGATNVSNTFASALWGLDFMYWWAQHNASGLNFHTGDRVAAGNTVTSARYTAFFSTTNGFAIRPLAYGIKAFELGSHGRLIPMIVSNEKNLNLSIYAVLGEDKNLYVTVINKESGDHAGNANLLVRLNDARFTSAEMMSLTSPGNDIAALQGQTLGGTEIKQDGDWNGQWSPVKSSGLDSFGDGVFNLNVPAANACIFKLTAFNALTAK